MREGLSISTDDAIPAILYGVANKVKMGLDEEETIKVAQTDILGFWLRDMSEIERDVNEIVNGKAKETII